ncbi:MAG TPA: NB-ARC domain-containing protein [Cytophagaceae bacterium]|jgi:hypothetical protein|nr:NB-ARC domain-containing protein [Cytophagaceae bacterium]
MTEEVIKIFKYNTDAPATNRGFYFQYLNLLQKWIKLFIKDENDSNIYSDVDEDIKEVGEELIFTQVKSYSKSFSFQSEEIKKGLFHFYMLFIQYGDQLNDCQFHFLTNTKISKNEKLLIEWANDSKKINEEIKQACYIKVKEIIKKEFKIRRDKKIQNKDITESGKVSIKSVYDFAIKELNDSKTLDFIERIKWKFEHDNPHSSILKLEKNILHDLKHHKFAGKPSFLLFNVFLSEIYKRSTMPNRADRALNNSILISILSKSDTEIQNYLNVKFTNLIGTHKYEILLKLEEIEQRTKSNEEKIKKLEHKDSIYPKELSFVPKIYSDEVIGREESVAELKTLLTSEKLISVHGIGGIGKTTILKYFLKSYYHDYDHIIWINRSLGLKSDFVLNKTLIDNLKLEITSTSSIEEKFDEIINSINKIKGRNLLIIDDVLPENDFFLKKELDKIVDWEILVTSRYKNANIKQYDIAVLDLESASRLFYKICSSVIYEKHIIEDFFQSISYNTLMIELSAKTINNAIGLDLISLTESVKSLELNNENFAININLDDSSTRILNHLLYVFSISNLTNENKYLLNTLSILPFDEIIIEEFIKIYGDKDYPKNKIFVVNQINELDKKGWIIRINDRIKIHKLIQHIIRYNIQTPDFLFINYLCHRMHEV